MTAKYGPIAYDTETTGLERYKDAKMFSFSECGNSMQPSVMRLDRNPSQTAKATRRLRQLFDGNHLLVMHNSKFDLGFTEKMLGEKVAERIPFHDTMSQSLVLQNHHHSHSLKDLSWELAEIPVDDDKEVARYTRQGWTYDMIPEEKMLLYQERDALRTIILHNFFYPQIQANPKWLACYENELRLQVVTLRMEDRGMMLNAPRCAELRDGLRDSCRELADRIEHVVGRRLNPNKAEHVQWLVYEYLGNPVHKVTAKSGAPSVDKEALDEIAENNPSPVLELVRQYRAYVAGASKLQTYLDLADADGTIHPNIKTCGARATCRESCSNPNLQNVEKEGGVRSKYPIPARRAFRPRPGYVNIHADYGGQEFRLNVHYSHEPELIDMVNRNVDVHAVAMRELLYPVEIYEECPRCDGTGYAPGGRKLCAKCGGTGHGKKLKPPKRIKQYRDATKNGNFAIAYGAGAPKLALTLNLPLQIVEPRYRAYKERWPLLASEAHNIQAIAHEQGYVETEFGRRLHLSRELSHKAMNYRTQGTGAEIVKQAQVRVHDYLAKATANEARLLLPIHDEIVFEYPRKRLRDLDEILHGVHALMIDFPQLSVPMEVEFQLATADWSGKQKIVLEDVA